jgi:hypothetical protein
MLATPRAHVFSDAERQPTDAPEPSGEQGQDKVQGMIDLGPDEDLLMLTPRAVGAYFILFHLSANRRQSQTSRACRQSRNKYIHRLTKGGSKSSKKVTKPRFCGLARTI